jgi:hypothetical protein
VLNSENSFIDPTIPDPGTFAYYLVTAFNSCGESP